MEQHQHQTRHNKEQHTHTQTIQHHGLRLLLLLALIKSRRYCFRGRTARARRQASVSIRLVSGIQSHVDVSKHRSHRRRRRRRSGREEEKSNHLLGNHSRVRRCQGLLDRVRSRADENRRHRTREGDFKREWDESLPQKRFSVFRRTRVFVFDSEIRVSGKNS